MSKKFRLFQRFSAARAHAPAGTRNSISLRIEELERRITPAQNTWIGPSGDFWSTAANWSTFPGPNQIPGSGDTVVFSGNSGTNNDSVVDGAFTVDRIEMDSTYGGNLSIGIGTSVTTTSHITAYGTQTVYPGASVNTNGTFYLTGGTIVKSGVGALSIAAANGFDMAGSIDVVAGVLSITTGAFTQTSGGVIFVEAGGVLNITATNQINFGGTIVVAAGGALNVSAPVISVHGMVVGGGATTVGPITLPPPPTTTGAISAGTHINEFGTLTTGLVLTPAQIAARVSAVTAAGAVAGAVFLNTNNLTVGAAGALNTGTSSEINVTDTATIQGTLNMENSTANIGTLTLQGGTMLLDGNSYGPTTVNVANPLTADAASNVTIQNGSTLDVTGQIDNYGTMTLLNATVDTNGYDLVVKPTTGVLNLSGTSMVQLGVSGPTGKLDVQGTLNQDWISAGGNTTIHGNLQNSGSFVFDTSASPWMTVTVQGNYTQTAGGSLTLKINGAGSGIGDRVTATGTFTRAGTLTVNAVGTLNTGTWTLVSGATLAGSFAAVNLPTPPAGKYWQHEHCNFALAI